MALIFESWQRDGAGQSRISFIRSDVKGWHMKSSDWLQAQKADPLCVLITKNRTDHQSTWEHIIWKHPGYIDPTV